MKTEPTVRERLLKGWKLNKWSGAVPANWYLTKKHCQEINLYREDMDWPMESELIESSHNRTYPSLCPGKMVNEDFLKVYAIKVIDWRPALQTMQWKKRYHTDIDHKRKLFCYDYVGVYRDSWVYGGFISLKNDQYEVFAHKEFGDGCSKKYLVPQTKEELHKAIKDIEESFKIWLNNRYVENKKIKRKK